MAKKLLGRRAGRPGFKKLFFAVDHGVDVVGGKLNAVSVSDCVGGAGFDAVAAEYASRVVDVVDRGVTFAGGNSLGVGIFSGFDIDAVRRASGGTQKAADALFESVFVALKDVNSAVARLNGGRSVRETLRRSLAEHG